MFIFTCLCNCRVNIRCGNWINKFC